MYLLFNCLTEHVPSRATLINLAIFYIMYLPACASFASHGKR